jgi:uncharacterized protein (TIGR00255 family)
MKSMTGYGHVSKSLGELDIAVDLRTLNSRYFDFRPRLGKELSHLEAELKKEIQRRLARGRVELYLEARPRASDQLELNEALARNYLDLAEHLRREGGKGHVRVKDLLNLPGVCIPKTDKYYSSESISQGIVEAVGEAIDQVLEARRSEGAALKSDLQKRLRRLIGHVDSVASSAEGISEFYQEKLGARLEELLGGHELDESRLAQEVFYYVEKSDIAEEITRLRSHLDQFSKYLEESEQGTVGKALDFLCQEMNREVNTILSKSVVVEISGIAIEAKSEVEKIREQVQNVE